MQNQFDITASIVVYNCNKELLLDTVESFLKCSLNKRIILYNNGSTNKESYDSLMKKYKNNPEVIFHSSYKNIGFGSGHNAAYSILKEQSIISKYHLVLNPDVIIKKNCLEGMLTFMEENKDIGLSVPKILYPDGRVQKLNRLEPTFFDLFIRRFVPSFIKKSKFLIKRDKKIHMEDIGYDSIYDVPCVSGCFMFFRSSTFEIIKGFDENFFLYFEDTDISKRVRKIARVVFFPDAEIIHAWKRDNHKNFRCTLHAIVSAMKYFFKHGFRFFKL